MNDWSSERGPPGMKRAHAALAPTVAASRIDVETPAHGDPRRGAVALAYDKQGNGAPRVIAKGYGLIADTIIQRAQAEGLYVHAAPDMVAMLMHVALDSEIPPPLYQAVAEVLGWLYQLESNRQGSSASTAVLPGAQTGARKTAKSPNAPPNAKPVGPRRF